MDFTAFFQNLMSSAAPVLPGNTLLHIALPVAWAIVLACGVLRLGRHWPPRLRMAVALLLGAVTLIPGPVSPAFWLGLAFQMPSLMTLLICLGFSFGDATTGRMARDWRYLSLAGLALGWLLLLDTLALLPFSLYHWGFSPVALAAVALLAALPWVVAGGASASPKGVLLTLSVLALFVATRLPTGNLWDALMDPWLWLALQVGWLRRAWRHLGAVRAGRRAPPAIPG